MFEFIITILIIIFFLFKYFNQSSLNTMLKSNDFSNIKKIQIMPQIVATTADSHGENYFFVTKNSISQFNGIEIDKIYEKASKLHYHNIIIISNNITSSSPIYKKIQNYGIDLWDNKKLQSMSISNATKTYKRKNTKSFLKTSDTSDDKCEIELNSFDPIQEPKKKLSFLFNKPDRL